MSNEATPIESLTPGTPKLTDVYAAVDPTDTHQAPTGTTKKYSVGALTNLMISQLGFSTYRPSLVATTANLVATYYNGPLNDGVNATLTNAGTQAPLVVDGVALANTNTVIVKNQSNPAQNGIYAVQISGTSSTNWLLVRVDYFNSPANITDNGAVESLEGTVNALKFWQVDFAGIIVVGTTPINFVPLDFGNAAFKDVTDNSSDFVVSMEGLSTINHLPKFSDTNGSITDSGIIAGTAAGKTASDNTKTYVAMVDEPTTIGHFAIFSDTLGTIEDSAFAFDTFLVSSNNLSDVASIPLSRQNLDVPTRTGGDASGTWTIDITGNAATVTTNANLTGDVTSVGNVTTYNGIVPLAKGGTNKALTPSNGGVVYSSAIDLEILAATPTANRPLMSGASTTPAWSTATYPPVTTANQVLYSSANNTVAGLPTLANGTLITSGASVPSLSQTLPLTVQSNITQVGIQTQNLDMGVHQIKNVVDPTVGSDAATKSYADSIAAGITVKPSCYATSTAAYTATYSNGAAGVGATLTNTGALAAFMADGILVPLGERVLIKNQVTTFQNGVYTVTNAGSGAVAWILTRATDYDQAAEIMPGNLFVINNGNTEGTSSWIQTDPVTTIGVDPIQFSKFTASLPIGLAFGGTSAALTANNGGVFYSTSTAGAILSGTPTSRQMLQSGSSSAPAWSTTTWPATSTINNILYSSANNVIGEITTAVNSALITNGAGLPSLSQTLPAAVQGNITSTGTVTSGVWNGTAINETHGGTNQTTYTLGDTLYSSAANTLSKLPGNITTSKLFLSQTGTGAVSGSPVWSTVTSGDITGSALTEVDDTNVTLTLGGSPSNALLNATSLTLGWTGQLGLTRGGTNSFLVGSAGGIVWSTASALQILAGIGTAGHTLQSGAAASPTWSTATYPSVATLSGTMLRANGTNWVASTSTFADTYATNNLLYANGANTVTGLATANSSSLATTSAGVPTWLGPLTNGQLVIGSTGATPVAASLTAGANISITPGAGSISIAATGLASNVLTNTHIYVGNAGNIATDVPLSGDGTLANTGALTVSSTAGVPFAASATTDTTIANNISGGTLPVGRLAGSYAGITGVGVLTSGTWNATTITAIHGGTGQSTYTLGDTLYSSAANTLSKLAGNTTAVKQYLSQTGTGAVSAAPVWATINGSDVTGAALTQVNDTNVTLTLGGTPATALLQATSITAGWSGQLSLARGGTNASLTASNGAVPYSTASAFALLAPGTSGQLFQSGGAGAPVWSTATYPATSGTTGTILRSNGTNFVNSTSTFADTYTASNLLYSNSANTVTGLATANNGVLITSGAGVPSISSTLPSAVQANITSTGTITSGTWQATVLSPTYGGTGVNNGTNTLTITANSTINQDVRTTANPTFASETLTNVTNQIVLGTTNTTTINSIAPAASRTYAINDLGAAGNFVLSTSTQSVKHYNGTATVAAPIQWSGTATTTTGIATFHPTVDGTTGTAALFTNIFSVCATPVNNTTTPINYPFASVQSVAAGNKTITVNVGTGQNVGILGSPSVINAPNGTSVYLTIFGN